MRTDQIDRRALVRRAAALGVSLSALGAAAAPSARNAALAADPVSLEFWTPANDPVGSGIIAKLVDDFNATTGKEKGITVNTRIKPATNDSYVQYTTAMTSSGSPDVVMTYSYNPVVAWAANGFLTPLDSYAETLGIKQEDFFPIAWVMSTFGGHTWGLLQSFDFYQFWANTGIHSGPMPKTFDELDKLAAEYTKIENGQLVQAGLIPWMNDTGPAWNTSWGGSFYDLEARKWTIDTPENAKFLTWFLKYVDMFGGRDKSDALESSVPRTYGDIFQYDKVAFALEGEWMPATLEQQGLKLSYAIAHVPTAENVPYGTGDTIGGNLFLVPAKAPHPAEAAVFVQHMTSKEGVLAWCLPNSNIPPVKAAAFDPSFLQQLPKLEPWLDSLKLDKMVPPNPSPQMPLFRDLLATAIDEVTYKKKSPEQALTDVAQRVAGEVAQFKEAHPDWDGE